MADVLKNQTLAGPNQAKLASREMRERKNLVMPGSVPSANLDANLLMGQGLGQDAFSPPGATDGTEAASSQEGRTKPFPVQEEQSQGEEEELVPTPAAQMAEDRNQKKIMAQAMEEEKPKGKHPTAWQRLTARALSKSWLATVFTGGLALLVTIPYLVIHSFGRLMGSEKFCKIGREWAIVGGLSDQNEIEKVSKSIGWEELMLFALLYLIIGLAVLDLIAIFFIMYQEFKLFIKAAEMVS